MRVWILAFRLKTLTAALVPILVGTSVVYLAGHNIRWSLSLYALISAALIQIGTNLFNDALDFRKGSDSKSRLGPSRVSQQGLLEPRIVQIAGVLSFLGSIVFAIPLVIAGGWPIVTIGIISLICGYCYTGGPYPLAYHGLGDLFVFVFFGIVAVVGTYFLHVHEVSEMAWVAGAQVGFLCSVLIGINNLRDIDEDRNSNKNTLAVLWGKTWMRCQITFLVVAPFALGIYWIIQDMWEIAVTPFLISPSALFLLRRIWQTEPSAEYNLFLSWSAAIHFCFGVAFTAGAVLWVFLR